MIVTGNRHQVRQLHVDSFDVLSGTFTKSGNEITCNADGYIRIKNPFQYGTWEYDFTKANVSAGPSYVGYGNGTSFRTTFDTRLQGYFPDGQAFYSGLVYNFNGNKYSYKVTRTRAGVTSWYYKGGQFGTEYVLMPVGYGSNPKTYTPSIDGGFKAQMKAGDKIGNVTFKPYI